MDADLVKTALDTALAKLAAEHVALFTNDANERSLTHWLAVLLGPHFPGWDVDCEYNRQGAHPKRVIVASNNVPATDVDAQTVYPDIIVHHRNTTLNLLVIEAKKTNRRASVVNDEDKLAAYTLPQSEGGLGYPFAAQVLFAVGPEQAAARLHRWFQRSGV